MKIIRYTQYYSGRGNSLETIIFLFNNRSLGLPLHNHINAIRKMVHDEFKKGICYSYPETPIFIECKCKCKSDCKCYQWDIKNVITEFIYDIDNMRNDIEIISKAYGCC